MRATPASSERVRRRRSPVASRSTTRPVNIALTSGASTVRPAPAPCPRRRGAVRCSPARARSGPPGPCRAGRSPWRRAPRPRCRGEPRRGWPPTAADPPPPPAQQVGLGELRAGARASVAPTAPEPRPPGRSAATTNSSFAAEMVDERVHAHAERLRHRAQRHARRARARPGRPRRGRAAPGAARRPAGAPPLRASLPWCCAPTPHRHSARWHSLAQFAMPSFARPPDRTPARRAAGRGAAAR